MAKEKEYKKLSGGRSWFRTARLWQGKDHLLLAQTMGYSEEYKRFYFRDIQAILLRPSNRRLVWGIVWATFFALFFLIGFFSFTHKELPYFWLFFILFYAVGFSVNLLQGPGCVCHLKTAIQTAELPIQRRRKADKIIGLLKPLIDAAQQNLPESASLGASSIPLSVSPSAQPVSAVPVAASPSPKVFHPWAHWALYSTLLALALLEASRFIQRLVPLYLLESALELSVCAISIFALIRQSGVEIPKMLRRVTVGAFLYMMADYIISFIYGIVLAVSNPQKSSDQWGWIKWLASQAPDKSGFTLFLAGYMIIGCLLFGLLGMVELGFYRKQRPAEPPGPSAGPSQASPGSAQDAKQDQVVG